MENAHWVLSVGNKIWLVDGQTREHTTGRVHPSFPSLHQLWRLTWPLASQEIPQFSLQKEVSSEKFFKLKNILHCSNWRDNCQVQMFGRNRARFFRKLERLFNIYFWGQPLYKVTDWGVRNTTRSKFVLQTIPLPQVSILCHILSE